MSENINLRNFALQVGDNIPNRKSQKKQPRPKAAGRFLKGPLCWDWLTAAAHLPGKALHVALVIQFRAGLIKSHIISLSSDELRRFGVERTTGYRALKSLEKGGLVAVKPGKGKQPIVTVKPVNSQLKDL